MSLPPVSFPTLGWQVRDWIEGYLVHGPGDVQGQPIAIDDEMAVHICWLYRVWPKNHSLAGRRLIQRGVLSRPKGRAKSEIGGMLVCAEALGPVRCDGFDANGDPVGRPVTYPFIRCLATEEEQSGNTYDNAAYMLQEGRVAVEYAVDVGLTKTYIKEPGGGEIVPSTAASASKEGGKETFAVADEPHLYILPQLHQMYRTVARNTGKRKDAEPWMYDTTTAYLPGEHSVAELAAERYAGLEAEELAVKRGVVYDHRQGAEPKRFGDDRSLIKAMREGYGPAAEWIDFQRIVRIIRDAEEPEAEAYRYWLNIPRKSASAFLAPDEIRAALRPESIVEPGTMVGMGFDGSESDDHTCLYICTREGLIVPVGIWTPRGEDTGWHEEVNEAVDWAFDNFKVLLFYADPAWWQEELAKWYSTYGPQKNGPDRVAEFWTGGKSEGKFAIACGALRTSIRNGGSTLDPIPLRTDPQTRDGKPLAVWHFENARTRKVRVKVEEEVLENAHTVRKERKGSPLKIDSVPASALARRARDEAEKKGLFDQPTHGMAKW